MDLKEHELREREAPHPWEQARLGVLLKLLRRHWKPGGGSVVDVGCGDLFVCRSLQKSFPDSHFIAIDSGFTPAALEKIQTSSALTALPSVAALSTLPQTRADLFLLLDVIEHVPDDRQLLTEILQSPQAVPGALIIITVPAFPSLFCSHDEFLGHYRRYTVGQLESLLTACGLEKKESGYFFSSLLVPRAMQTLKERFGSNKKKTEKGLGQYRGTPWVDAAIVQTLLWDASLCRGFSRLGVRVPGLSCFAVAQIPNS